MSAEEQGKRGIDAVSDSAEEVSAKKVKVDTESTETAEQPSAAASSVEVEVEVQVEPTDVGAAPTSGSPKRSFDDLSEPVKQLFQDCFDSLKLTSNDLDTCVYDSLCDFSEEMQNEIVSSFCRSELTSIRNKTGYFIGILKQYRKNGKAQSGGGRHAPPQQAPYAVPFMGFPGYPGYPAAAPGAAQSGPKATANGQMSALPASVQAKFQAMFAQGQVSESDLDKSIFDSLMDFDETTAGNIVDRYSSSSLATVRNKTGYFISLLKLARQARQNGQGFASSRDGPVTAGGPPMGGAAPYGYPPQPYADPYAAYYAAAAAAGLPPPPYAPPPPQPGPPAADPYAAYYAAAAQQAAQAGYPPHAGAPGAPPQAGYPQAAGAPQAGYPQQAAPAAQGGIRIPMSFYKISQGAQNKLAALYNSYSLNQDDVEDCVFDSLADFPENEQVQMCEAFTNANLVSVRNKTAFFIGILKRHRQNGSTSY